MLSVTGLLQKWHRATRTARIAHTLHIQWPHSSAVSWSRPWHIPHFVGVLKSFFIPVSALAIFSTALFSSALYTKVFFKLSSYSMQLFLRRSSALLKDSMCFVIKWSRTSKIYFILPVTATSSCRVDIIPVRKETTRRGGSEPIWRVLPILE